MLVPVFAAMMATAGSIDSGAGIQANNQAMLGLANNINPVSFAGGDLDSFNYSEAIAPLAQADKAFGLRNISLQTLYQAFTTMAESAKKAAKKATEAAFSVFNSGSTGSNA